MDGPPGEHRPGSTAQIYRVRFDGSGIEALTVAPGCHFAPAVGRHAQVFFVHTNCMFGRSLSVLDAERRTVEAITSADERRDEAHLSPDGRRLLFSQLGVSWVQFGEVRLADRTLRTLVSAERTAPRSRPQYGAKPTEMLFQNAGAVWLFDGHSPRRVLDLTQEGTP